MEKYKLIAVTRTQLNTLSASFASVTDGGKIINVDVDEKSAAYMFSIGLDVEYTPNMIALNIPQPPQDKKQQKPEDEESVENEEYSFGVSKPQESKEAKENEETVQEETA